MPYIKITEEDITPFASFDTVENVVLVFGFDYRILAQNSGLKFIKDFKLFTSLRDFYTYIKANNATVLQGDMSYPSKRGFVTAYDCLANGLPVIYVPLDDYIPEEAIYENSEGVRYLNYDWLSNPDIVPSREDWPETLPYEYHDRFANKDQNYAGDAIIELVGANEITSEGSVTSVPKIDFADRINMPFTFITTAGLDNKLVYSQIITSCAGSAGRPRYDFLYLYDIAPNIEPADIIAGTAEVPDSSAARSENTALVYPWGTYSSNTSSGSIHMPGSYGYLMAYANSIKTNKPWLAVAGIHRGYIPNILGVDYQISEPYIHAFQGDDVVGTEDCNVRVNPIVNFGQNMGTIIFGNRTNFIPSGTDVSFKSFLNIRLLLIFLNKQAYVASVQHMFEPNDDIVWLSFKQKVNELLEQMVSGRGIKWYKWYKLQPDRLGQIKAKLVIRPIEAVEAFEVIISMTDTDISVTLQGE